MCLWLFLWFPIFAPFELQLLQLSLGHSFCPRFLCKLVQNEQRRDVFPSCVTRNWPSVQKQALAKSPEVQASWNANPQNNRKNSGAATPKKNWKIHKLIRWLVFLGWSHESSGNLTESYEEIFNSQEIFGPASKATPKHGKCPLAAVTTVTQERSEEDDVLLTISYVQITSKTPRLTKVANDIGNADAMVQNGCWGAHTSKSSDC